MRRGGLWETYLIKAKCYWEHPWGTHWELREHIGNVMETHWKLERNIAGTCWEQRKNEKKNFQITKYCEGKY